MRRSRASAQRCSVDDLQNNSIQSSHSSNAEEPFSNYTLDEEDEEDAVELRRELKFFFMNPIEKYKARGRKPFKFGIQLFKILVVTIQLVFFGQFQYQFTKYINDNQKAMEHIFLKDWDPVYDSFAYPSTKRLYALYTQDDFFEHLDNVAYQYANIETIGIGTYNFEVDNVTHLPIRNLTIHLTRYIMVEQSNTTFNVSLGTKTDDFTVTVDPHHNISMKNIIMDQDPLFSFDTLIEFKVKFILKSILIKDEHQPSATCINFDVKVCYQYVDHGGRIPVSLESQYELDTDCTKNLIATTKEMDKSRLAILCYDVFVMIICLISFILCLRSLLNGRHLKKKTDAFFNEVYKKKLSRSDSMEFLNLWYVIICVSDCLTISGTICKILLDFKLWAGSDYCSLLLGCATSLVWFGILRYMGFFNEYNVLLVTLKKSMPNVLRFTSCAGIIYLAYGFCGWIILGPYHGKFRTFTITMECMFSLINGDDMFATYEEMPDDKLVIFAFSKLYLYSFISLFIYVVLSLFISVIMDTYETVKDFQRSGHIEGGDLKRFIALCEDVPESGFFRRKAKRNWKKVRKSIRRYSSFEQTHHNEHHHVNQHLLSNGPSSIPM